MSKHSKAPWIPEVVFVPGEGKALRIMGGDGYDFVICDVFGIDEKAAFDPQSWANARLIAKAPEMYEALKEVAEWFSVLDSWVSAVPTRHPMKYLAVLKEIDS